VVGIARAGVGIARGCVAGLMVGEGDRPPRMLCPRGPTGDRGPFSRGESRPSVRTGDGDLLRTRSGAVGVVDTGEPVRTGH
jgi:hypothetical protein